MKRKTPEERYKDKLLKQHNALEEFAEHETEWAENLIWWYRVKKQDMPEDEYRACAFFINREFANRPGSLTLLYDMYQRCCNELPNVTKENAFDLLTFKFRLYAKTLEKTHDKSIAAAMP